MSMPRLVSVALIFSGASVTLFGADAPPVVSAPAPVADAPAPPKADAAPVVPKPAELPSNWTFKGRLGAFLNNTSSDNAETSHDATINGTTSSTAYLLTLETALNWKSDADSVDNLLKARYGKVKQHGSNWIENNDEIRYDGVYRREISKPWFVYLGWGAESVFTGPDPYNYAFDPLTVRISGGFGNLYENFLPDKNRLEWRLGARVQKRWGQSLAEGKDRIETGAEAFLRYDHDMIEPGAKTPLVRFFAQYEGFAEFSDMEHVTNLVTSGLAVQFSRYLSAEIGVRAFYETKPKEYDGTVPGYSQWSIRQDVLVGVTYLF